MPGTVIQQGTEPTKILTFMKLMLVIRYQWVSCVLRLAFTSPWGIGDGFMLLRHGGGGEGSLPYRKWSMAMQS